MPPGPTESSLAGGCLMLGFPGTELDAATRRLFAELRPAGAILFGRNLERPSQIIELTGDLRGLLPDPGWVAIDQEGGRVSRLEPWIGPTPAAAELACGPGDAIRSLGQQTGRTLRSLGFNLDFAPVVDLCSPAEGANAIGDRSFGVDVDRVVACAGDFLDGLQGSGVAGCLKHFPGLGRTTTDTHQRPAQDLRGLDEIGARDLVPFRVLGQRAVSVMVGHARYPALEPDPERPASLSHSIVSGLLRNTLGFRGLVVTDDLEMGAVSSSDEGGLAAIRAVEAGCDLLLYCKEADRAREAFHALRVRAGQDPDFARLLEAAGSRVSSFARRWPLPRGSVAAWERARRGLVGRGPQSRGRPFVRIPKISR